MLSLPYKQPEKWAAFSPKPSDSVGFFHIVACSLNSLIFSLPFANCVIIQGGAPPGHFEMLLFSLLYFTIFIPNDCHGNKLSPFHEHTTYVKMDQKKQKHSLFWGECMWLLPLHSLALLLSYQITVCIPQYPFKQQNKQQAFFFPLLPISIALWILWCVSQSGCETWRSLPPLQWALTQHYTNTLSSPPSILFKGWNLSPLQ